MPAKAPISIARMTGPKMTGGTAGWTRVKRSRSRLSNMGGEALSWSVRAIRRTLSRNGNRLHVHRLWGASRRQLAPVDAVALDDAAVHRLHAAVHTLVRLEDPAHLTALDAGVGSGGVEV